MEVLGGAMGEITPKTTIPELLQGFPRALGFAHAGDLPRKREARRNRGGCGTGRKRGDHRRTATQGPPGHAREFRQTRGGVGTFRRVRRRYRKTPRASLVPAGEAVGHRETGHHPLEAAIPGPGTRQSPGSAQGAERVWQKKPTTREMTSWRGGFGVPSVGTRL